MTTHNNRPLTKRIEERSEELTPLGRQMVDYLMRNPNDLLRLAKLAGQRFNCHSGQSELPAVPVYRPLPVRPMPTLPYCRKPQRFILRGGPG